MTRQEHTLMTPPVEQAIAELRGLIASHYADATFVVREGEDPEGMCLVATVDVEDMGEVVDVFLSRLVDYQIDEDLDIDVLAVRPLKRNLEILERQQALAAAQAKAS